METIKANLLTSQQMIEKANLGWRVLQAPLLYEGNGLSKFAGKVVNFREDTGAPLGVVGDGYRIVQNTTAFAFLDSLLGDSIEAFIKAGSWKGGARVFIRAKLPGNLVFAGNSDDRGEKWVDFYTSHDGSSALEVKIIAGRLVCANGLIANARTLQATRVRHTANLSLETIRRGLGILNQQFDQLVALSNRMAAQPFAAAKMPEVLEKVGLVPAGEVKRSSRAQNIINEVSALFNGQGRGANLAGTRGTVWGAYNAITEFVDHHRGSDGEKRAESAAIGSGARVKETALEVLSA